MQIEHLAGRYCIMHWIAYVPLRYGVSIIIVDHHLALALSDSTVALERGQVIHSGPSDALRDDLDLRRKVLWL